MDGAKRKKDMDTDTRVVIVEGSRGMKGLNGNGKYNKIIKNKYITNKHNFWFKPLLFIYFCKHIQFYWNRFG